MFKSSEEKPKKSSWGLMESVIISKPVGITANYVK
jgi:hypothetical protein